MKRPALFTTLAVLLALTSAAQAQEAAPAATTSQILGTMPAPAAETPPAPAVAAAPAPAVETPAPAAAAPAPSLAQAPIAPTTGLTKLTFDTVTCSKVNPTPPVVGPNMTAPVGATFVKIDCSAEDLQRYPFLAELTKDPVPSGDNFIFGVAKVLDTVMNRPFMIVNMQNSALFTDWGASTGFAVNNDGTYHLVWKVTGGMVEHTLACPTRFTYVMQSSAREKFAGWTYDGKEMTQTGEYNSVAEAAGACH